MLYYGLGKSCDGQDIYYEWFGYSIADVQTEARFLLESYKGGYLKIYDGGDAFITDVEL